LGLVTVALRTTTATPLAGTFPRPTTWTSIVWPPATRAAGAPLPVRVSSRRAGVSGRKSPIQPLGVTAFEAPEMVAAVPLVAVPVSQRTPGSEGHGSPPAPDQPQGSIAVHDEVTYTPKWRCGPELHPVLPLTPMTCARSTICPGLT